MTSPNIALIIQLRSKFGPSWSFRPALTTMPRIALESAGRRHGLVIRRRLLGKAWCCTLRTIHVVGLSMKFWPLIIALITTGCFADAPKFNVRVCGDVRIPEDVDAYRIVVFDEDLSQELRSGAEDLVICPGDRVRDLPRSSSFESVVGESWVRVQGLKDGIVVTTFDRRVRANEDDDVDITVGMTRACLGASCDKGLTCYDGVCQAAQFDSNDSVCSGADVPIVDDPDALPFCPVEEGGML